MLLLSRTDLENDSRNKLSQISVFLLRGDYKRLGFFLNTSSGVIAIQCAVREDLGGAIKKEEDPLSPEALQKALDSFGAPFESESEQEIAQRIQEFLEDATHYLSQLSSLGNSVMRKGLLNISDENQKLIENVKSFLAEGAGWLKIQQDAEAENVPIENNIRRKCEGQYRELSEKFAIILLPSMKVANELLSRKIRGEKIQDQMLAFAGLTGAELNGDKSVNYILENLFQRQIEIPFLVPGKRAISGYNVFVPSLKNASLEEWKIFAERMGELSLRNVKNMLLANVTQMAESVAQLLENLKDKYR